MYVWMKEGNILETRSISLKTKSICAVLSTAIQIIHVFISSCILPVVGSNGSWLAVVFIRSLPVAGLYPSHPQPEPWIATVLLINSFFMFSNKPKSLLIMSIRSPFGSPPPVGLSTCQNKEWLIWPPPLNLSAGWRLMTCERFSEKTRKKYKRCNQISLLDNSSSLHPNSIVWTITSTWQSKMQQFSDGHLKVKYVPNQILILDVLNSVVLILLLVNPTANYIDLDLSCIMCEQIRVCDILFFWLLLPTSADLGLYPLQIDSNY